MVDVYIVYEAIFHPVDPVNPVQLLCYHLYYVQGRRGGGDAWRAFMI